MTVNVNIGSYRQLATLSAPGSTAPDGDGGFVVSYSPLSPASWRCAIERASVASAERHFAATVIAQATHVLTGRFHSGISTQTRLVWVDRAGVSHTANALDVVDVEGAGVETIVAASEVLTATPPTDTSWVQGGFIQ